MQGDGQKWAAGIDGHTGDAASDATGGAAPRSRSAKSRSDTSRSGTTRSPGTDSPESAATPRDSGRREGRSRRGRRSAGDGARSDDRDRSKRGSERARGGSGEARQPKGRVGDDLPPPALITDDAGLRELCDHLADQARIAIDTEADSFFSYRERVCLVQVSTPAGDWVVDPLADLDLAPLGEVLADPARCKIFHDGEYDVLLFKREHGFEIANIFDTRIAAAALGYESVGLAGVLERHFGVVLDKKQQLSDWSKRPLTDDQIRYARLDTHYLVELASQLEDLLGEQGRMPVLEGECARLEALEVPDRSFDPDEFIRLKGARALDLARMAVLRELFVERDAIASERNVPPFKVVSHSALVEAARRRPRNGRDLESLPGMSRKLVQRHGKRLIAAIERGQEAGPLERAPRLAPKDGTGHLDERGTELHDRLKTLRKKLADAEGFDSSLAINRRTLLDLAAKAPTEADALPGVEGLLPWQIASFGDAIVDAVRRFDRDWASGAIQPRRGRRRSN